MANQERLRDLVPGGLDADLVSRRQAAGWRMVAVEWDRAAGTGVGPEDVVDVPFGFRIAADCRHLEEDPAELAVLRLIMRLVVEDRRLSNIAEDLNLRGHKTRSGGQWTSVDVFRLMPVLVDNGPRIFAHRDWPMLRHA